MNLYLTAAGLGLSFGNLWVCVLLVFSLQTTNRHTAAGYLAGRALALILLCVAAALLGRQVPISHAILHLTAGLFLVGFSFWLLAVHVFSWIPPWKARTRDKTDCDHQCDSCLIRHEPEAHDACSDCHDHGICSAEEPEVRELTLAARRTHGKPVEEGESVSGFFPGVLLGALRGAAMCSKLLVLLPLLLSATWTEALGVGIIFSLSSSLYPLLGFVFGRFALRLVSWKKPLFWFTSAFLLAMGVRMLVKAAWHA